MQGVMKELNFAVPEKLEEKYSIHQSYYFVAAFCVYAIKFAKIYNMKQ